TVSCVLCIYYVITASRVRSTRFPYSTLFRSRVAGSGVGGWPGAGRHRAGARLDPEGEAGVGGGPAGRAGPDPGRAGFGGRAGARSEEHTSELQSRENLVCRLLLEKKNSTRTD